MGQAGVVGGPQESREGKEGKGLGPAPQACAILQEPWCFQLWYLAQHGEPAAAVAASRPILHGVPPRQPGGDSAGHAVPRAPALQPHFMEQPTSPSVREDSWRPAHPPPPPQEAGGPGSPLRLGQLMFAGLLTRHACSHGTVLRTLELSPGSMLSAFGGGPWPGLV